MLFPLRIDATLAVVASVFLVYLDGPLFSALAGAVFGLLTLVRWTPRSHVPTVKTLVIALTLPVLLTHAAGAALQIAPSAENGALAVILAGVLTLAAIAVTSGLAARSRYVPF